MSTGDNARRFSRRRFLAKTGTGLALAGLAPALSAPFVSRARAADKTLKIIQWSHFVPAYDTWIDAFAKDWGEKNGIDVTVDHIPALEMPARAAAEVAAQAGHDLFAFNGSGGPHLYIKHRARSQPAGRRDGGQVRQGRSRSAARSPTTPTTNTWPAFPDYYVRFPGLYRKDLWDEIGMVPDTWEDILKGGAKLKAKGNPVGIGLGHSVDPNLSWRGLMWSYGATEVDASGKQVTINSKETLEAVKLARAIYKEAMDPEVLSWDDAGNNRFLASGKGCWIHNPISAYRTIQQSNPELADKIFLWKTPAGPVRRLVAGSPNSYVDLEVRAQPGRRARVPALLCRALGRGLQGEHGLQPPDLPERRARSRCRSCPTTRARIRPTSSRSWRPPTSGTRSTAIPGPQGRPPTRSSTPSSSPT